MNILDYLSRNYLGPLYNIRRGFGEINSQIPAWQEIMALTLDEVYEFERRRLADILKSAYQNTKYYRDLFDLAGIADKLEDPDVLTQIPLLTKDIIRKNTEAMLNSGIPRDDILETMTGGSTSDPLIFYRDRSTYCNRWGLQIAANMSLGWEPGEWYALVWGANQDLPQDYSARYRLLNFLVHRRIILNAALLTDEQTIWFVKELRRHNPRIVYGYPVMLDLLASAIRDNDLEVPSPEKIIVTAEALTPSARENIESVFRAPVFDRYASREFGVVADQCPGSDLLRAVPGTVKIEILPISKDDPSFGEMVITDLLNVGMPFIRYRTGDIARLTEGEVNGKPGMFLSEIAGRTTDMIVSPNGRIISGTALTPSFFGAHPGVKQAQIRQTAPDQFHILIVRNFDHPMNDAEAKIAETLGGYCGVKVFAKVEYVESIPRDKSGKFRFVISSVSPELLRRTYNTSGSVPAE